MSLDISEKLSFLYAGIAFPDGVYLSDVTLETSKDVFLITANGFGERIEEVLLGSISPIPIPENQVDNIALSLDNTLTITTTLGVITFDNFVANYTWSYPESTGVGFKLADQNTFKPLVSVHEDLTITELENGDVKLEVAGALDGIDSIGNSNLIELSVVRYSDVVGFARVLANPSDEVNGTYKKLPFNYATETPGLVLDETGSFRLPPGRYYVDFVVNVRVGRRSKVALFNDVTGDILLHGVGNYNTGTANIGIGNVSMRGFVDVTNTDFMSMQVLGYDLGTYYSPDTDIESPIVVHKANVFKLNDLPLIGDSLEVESIGASSHHEIYVPDNVIVSEEIHRTRTTADCWLSAINRSDEAEFLTFHFSSPTTVNGLLLQGRHYVGIATTITVDSTLSRDFVFQAYDTNLSEWINLFVSPDESVFSILGKYYYTFENSIAYVDYRLWFKPLTESTQVFQQRSIGRLELYGVRI